MSRSSRSRKHVAILIASMAVLAAACTNSQQKAEAVATPTSTPVFDVEDTGRLPLPTVPVPVQNVPAEVYDVACIGAERTFPVNLEPFSTEVNEIELLAAWTTYLAGSTIVDSNSLVKAFDLYDDGTGAWIDSDLRPVLHGHKFTWAIDVADGEQWSDVDLTLSFDESNYEIVLPLRRRGGQIVDRYETEGLVVTETRECGEFVAAAEPAGPIPIHMWQPSPGPGTPPLPPTIPTTIKPSTMLYADGHIFAANGSPSNDFFWEKLTLDGEPVAQFRAARSNVEDALFDGEFLWFSDRGEGELRKFDLDGNRVDTYSISNAGKMAFDGEFIWVTQNQQKSLLKLTRDGDRVLTLELPSPPGEIEAAGGLLWVGLPEEWSVGVYTLEGELFVKSYVQSRPGAMEFDGQNMWVTVPTNFQVRKISPSGDTLLTFDLPFAVGPSHLVFDGQAMWVVKARYGTSPGKPNINETYIYRVDLAGDRTGQFHPAFPARDVAFDGTHLWLSHEIESSFTRLRIDTEARSWVPSVGPYTERELAINSGEDAIFGTLTVPEGDGPFPAVIVVPNVNGTNRDTFRFGRWLGREGADDLVRSGLAVFRYDLPGLGTSPGRVFDFTYRELADDLHEVIDAIKTRPEVDSNQVGLWANGAPLWYTMPVANERDDIAFLVTGNYGMDKPLITQYAPQMLNLRFITESEEEIRLLAEHYNLAIETARRGTGWDEFEYLVRTLENNDHFNTDPITQQPFLSLRRMQSRWWPGVIDFEATGPLEAVTETPLVIVYGGLNLVVHPDVHSEKAQAAIDRSGNPDAHIVIFEKMNNEWQPANTGQFDEVIFLPQVFYPSYIRPGPREYLINWILERVTLPEGWARAE